MTAGARGTSLSGRVLLVGCGRMGRALAAGWLARGLARAGLIAVEPNPEAAAGARGGGIPTVGNAAAVDPSFNPDWVVLAVKPQVFADAAPPYARYAPAARFLSIVAGRPLSSLRMALGADAAVVRAMPNTPSAVGRGITVACAGPAIPAAARAHCTELLEAVGEVAWIDDESLMDAVTATSGSGPAYVFLLIECLAEAGREAGLPEGLAARLALATVAGAGELARASGEAPADLRAAVTSRGGTTEAALKVLMKKQGGLQSLLTRAVAAAAERSRELAG